MLTPSSGHLSPLHPLHSAEHAHLPLPMIQAEIITRRQLSKSTAKHTPPLEQRVATLALHMHEDLGDDDVHELRRRSAVETPREPEGREGEGFLFATPK
jgi:hypothetical protein